MDDGCQGSAGDDLGDLPAFEAATAAGGYPLVIDGPDMSPKVGKIAGAHFDRPQDFQSWLRQLDHALR